MRIIRITGKGEIKVHPDTTRITVTLSGLYKDYGSTLSRSSEDTERLRELVTRFGFRGSDLKTLSFDVQTQNESYRDHDTYKTRFIGYRYTHRMKIEFDSDNERLGRILYALAGCPLRPEFTISYTVKDTEAVKNTLLGKAAADARAKAEALAEAAGVRLKDIQSIDYSWGKVLFEETPINNLMAEKCMADEELALNIEPDDIEVSDTVTVVWEIE